MLRKNFIGILLLCSISCIAQSVTLLDSVQEVSLRGLSVVNDSVFWWSGNKGTVGLNVGNQLRWVQVDGFESRDFRDIHAFSDKIALIMAVDSPGIILRTIDGGEHWAKVYEDYRPGIFLDAMEIDAKGFGWCIGDPINGKFVMANTLDSGKHWETLPEDLAPFAVNGEALFAASGTNLKLFGTPSRHQVVFVTGGTQSRLIIETFKGRKQPIIQYQKIPLTQGKATTGANSLCFTDGEFWIVGGDFNRPNRSDSNSTILYTGKKISQKFEGLDGYKSCIVASKDGTMVACSPQGVALLKPTDKTDKTAKIIQQWLSVSTIGFHTAQPFPDGKRVALAGPFGRIGILQLYK